MSGRHTTFGNATNTTNGAGPKNLQLFMLSSDGTVLHCLPGFWNSRDLVYEMVFAAQLDELYKDRSLSRVDKASKFRQLQMAHTKEHSNAMKRRSRMQGFDQQYEAKNRLTTTDTIRDINLVKASLQSGSHIPGHAFKTTDQILHERMASRPFIHYTRFDVAKFSDYGKPIYDKNEDQRDYRTGQTVVHNQKKDIIGNPIALAKKKYGKKWRQYVQDDSTSRGWGADSNRPSEGAWTTPSTSHNSTWGGSGGTGQGSLWGAPQKAHGKKKNK